MLLLHGPEEEAAGARPEEQRQSEHTGAGVQTAGVSCSLCLQSLMVSGQLTKAKRLSPMPLDHLQ